VARQAAAGRGLPGEPRWLEAAAYAALCTALLSWAPWPGYMSYDSFVAYEQAHTGVRSMTWPPIHGYLFWLSGAVGAESWGAFLAQGFILFLGAGLALNLLAASRAGAYVAQAGFAATVAWFPGLLGVAMTQWRDVATGGLALLAMALWLAAARRRSTVLIVAAAAAIGLGAAFRYNAAPLFVLAAPLMIWRPFLGEPSPGRTRAAAAAALIAFGALAWASTVWRLPDLARPPPSPLAPTIQLYDLVGISACAGRSYVPSASTRGVPLDVAQIRQMYDARHINLTFAPKAGLPRIYKNDAPDTVRQRWFRAVLTEPGCYLTHRGLIMVRQLGLASGPIFYPTHGVIDPNRFGLRLARPATATAVNGYLLAHAGDPWRRPILLYGLAAAAVLLVVVRRREAGLFFTAWYGGALAFVALLFLIQPAADARYIFPPNVVCALLAWGGLAITLAGGRRKA
jgi:hypothetical protein